MTIAINHVAFFQCEINVLHREMKSYIAQQTHAPGSLACVSHDCTREREDIARQGH